VKKPARGELDIDTKTRNGLLRSLRYQSERVEHKMTAGWAVPIWWNLVPVRERSPSAAIRALEGERGQQPIGRLLPGSGLLARRRRRARARRPGTPSRFTHPVAFRRCPRCQERNLVKNDDFVCVICGAELPWAWNVDPLDERRRA
jgi:hypothetical protein